MFEQLKAYNPSEKGRELIALLFPLSHLEREKNIVEYWNHYPQEKQAVLDGFHFIIQEIMESRQAGIKSDVINLPESLLEMILNQMVAEKNYFTYKDSNQFFDTVFKTKPAVFKDNELIIKITQKHFKLETEKKSTSKPSLPYSDEIDTKLKSICNVAGKAYSELTRIQRSINNSQKFIDSYKSGKSDISIFEVKLAKETFLESKKIYNDNSSIIAKGMQHIYEIYQNYSDQIVVKKSYIKYLAKLLGSREARNPPENYILALATGDFDFNVPDFEPTDLQLQHGKTRYSLQKEYSLILQKDINRLEARYRKRKLTIMLKNDVAKTKIIQELQDILKLDPMDIKTYIFLAKLFADYSNSFSDHKKRGIFREQALRYCETAFSKIDDYLDLQAIKQMKDRDIARSGFVKTISSIRIPLIKKT
ncbi:hypothetical protein KJ966_10440 [bacterium]|nr:hypothetical protein [bacterium]